VAIARAAGLPLAASGVTVRQESKNRLAVVK
jgi:hypothetical protein